MISAIRFDHSTWSKGDEPGVEKTGLKVRPCRVFASALLLVSLADDEVDFLGFCGVAVAGGTDIFLGYGLVFGYLGVKSTLFRKNTNDCKSTCGMWRRLIPQHVGVYQAESQRK